MAFLGKYISPSVEYMTEKKSSGKYSNRRDDMRPNERIKKKHRNRKRNLYISYVPRFKWNTNGFCLFWFVVFRIQNIMLMRVIGWNGDINKEKEYKKNAENRKTRQILFCFAVQHPNLLDILGNLMHEDIYFWDIHRWIFIPVRAPSVWYVFGWMRWHYSSACSSCKKEIK